MRIIHPRPQDGRQSDFGVEFVDGVAEVESLHPERELALLQHGFTIERTAPLDDDGPFEPLPEYVEGDTKPKTSRPRKK